MRPEGAAAGTVFVSHSAQDKGLYSSLCLALDQAVLQRWDLSLLCMLLAFGELRRGSGLGLKELNIVVYRNHDAAAPAISEKSIRRTIEVASQYWSD